MAFSSSNKPNVPITGINVTPLVDITLVLLIIFMVTAKLVVSRALPLDLPQAATGGEVQTLFSVTLRQDGALELDGQPTAREEEVVQKARAALRQNPELRAVVQADGAVPHRRVMQALDLLRQAGLARVAFAVQDTPPLDLAVEASP
jgi:biopolymer transport protein ExbD